MVELLEQRRLLAFGVVDSSSSIDSSVGICRPVEASGGTPMVVASADAGNSVSALVLSEESSVTDSVVRPVPEGVGVMPLEPEELVELERLFWENGGFDRGGGEGASSGGFEQLSLSDTFRLHSRPSSTKTLYLDFDGFVARGTPWNSSYGVSTITSPAYDPAGNGPSFTDTELLQIQQIWHRVAEDFAPFDVNVTTEEPPESDLVNTGNGDERWGLRSVQTIDNFASCGCGGFAYINSFNWGYNSVGATDTPAYTFNSSPTAASQTHSHETGHALGLSHDGTTASHPSQPNAVYYFGHGAGETGWGPIMGAPFSRNIVTWDQGEYFGANNGGGDANYNRGRDDLAIITTFNGFGYRPDDAGNTTATATEINYDSVNGTDPTLLDVSFFGVVERTTDLDVIRFSTGAGEVNLTIESYASQAWVSDGSGGFTSVIENTNFTPSWQINQGTNLDVSARILDASGNVVATSNPTGMSASFLGLSLPAGIYYLEIDGAAFGSPTNSSGPDGYTEYGSLGQYYVLGTVVDIGGPIAVASAESIEFTDFDDLIVSVTYSDRDGVDATTLGTGDIRVIGPNGYNEIASYVGILDDSDVTEITAAYSIPAPSGVWDSDANGDYSVLMVANQVADLDGDFSEAGPIGSFIVDVAPTIGPDGYGYAAYPVRYEFQDISASGQFILRGNDDVAVPVTPGNGFEFNFYGVDYQSLFISSNGLLTFGEANSNYVNSDLTNDPQPASIAVLWDDLFAQPTEGVYWQVLGSGDQQQLVVQWETGYFSGNGRISLQAILSEEDNTIQFNYRDLLGGNAGRDEGFGATVGTKDVGPQGNERLLVSLDGSGSRYVGSGRSLFIEKANRPMTELQISSLSVVENAASGTVVGQFSTIDPDADDTFTYELVSGDGDFDNGNFEIVGDELRTLMTFDYEQVTSQLIRVRTTDSGGNQLESSFVVNVVDSPELVSVVVGDGTGQRSRVAQLAVTFEGLVDTQDGAFRVIQRESGEEVVVTVDPVTDGQGRTVATLTFAGPLTRANGGLVDGNYELVIDGTKIVRNGQTLDANQDGVGGDSVLFGQDAADNFFAFYGDVDGDRAVTLPDLLAFRAAFASSSSDSHYNRSFDFTDDGFINLSDLTPFRNKFGTSLDF